MIRITKSFIKIFLLNLLFVISVSKADIVKIANEIMNQIKFEAIIAVQPIDPRASKISISSSKSLVDKLTNSIQISSQSNKFKITLVERSKLDAIMLEQEEFQNVSEFSDLVSNLGADVLISPSVNRLNDKEVEISARAIGVKGDNAGKVLSASNTYKIELPAKYVFVVNSLTSGDKDRSSYASSINSGLSSFNEVLVKDKNNVDVADYIIDLNFSLTVTEKETKESKEASAQSENNKMASEMFGSMLGGKDNPFDNLLKKGSEQNKQKASVFHTSRIFWCVFPFMIIEIASWAGYLLLNFNTKPETILITLLLAGIWLITFFVQVPQHQQMAQSYDINLIQKLVNKNWIRTIFWTLKLIILILFIN